jgi:hypothetical protein
MMVWNPQQYLDGQQPISLADITEPPCKGCDHFKPRVITNEFGAPAQIRLCISPRIYADFSCFKAP